jgi:hypothetical protein
MNKQNEKLIEKSTTLAKEIIEDSKNQKNYHTGSMFENVFASMFNKMPIDHLEKYRALINKIIAEKKKGLRIKENDTKQNSNKK